MDSSKELADLSPKVSFQSAACAVCSNLRRMFKDSDYYVTQGSFDDILKTPCSGHDLLLNYIREDLDNRIWNADNADDGQTPTEEAKVAECQDVDKSSKGKEADEFEMKVSEENKTTYASNETLSPGSYNISFGWMTSSNGKEPIISVETSPAGIQFWTPLMARHPDEIQSPGYGRIVDPEWVDLEMVKRWKWVCRTQHKDKCQNPLGITPVSPAWLIDTVNNCLVSGADISDYVALSYRWGDSAGFCTNLSLLETLQQTGALSQSHIIDSMPPTLRHVTALTRAIDERYLWIDSICIVQDDEAHCAEQLQLMGAIYASATLTVVASDGSAMDGLRGLRGISPPPEYSQNIIPIFEDQKLIFRTQPDFRSGTAPYFERGWTFQEFYLSKRRLTLAKDQIHWHCACADWHEDVIPSDDASPNQQLMDRYLHDVLLGMPDFPTLEAILGEYNSRKFTFPEDIVPGISGLLAIFSRSFDGGFLFGLPETCFDSALMWRMLLPTTGKRRKASGQTRLLTAASQLPSWSWVGWEGRGLQISSMESLDYPQGGRCTFPITQWYTHKTASPTEKRPIRSNWFRLREQLHAVEHDLPAGWEREKYNEAKHNKPPVGLGQYVYRHRKMPDRYFRLPVPVAGTGNQAELFNPIQTPYISSITKRGWFPAAKFPASYFSNHERAYEDDQFNIGLLDSNGDYCGQLYLDNTDDAPGFPEAGSGHVLTTEIVVICRRSESISSMRWRTKGQEDCSGQPAYAEVYGILWIEWSGVAHRKASGIISKEAWEKHELEVVELVLG